MHNGYFYPQDIKVTVKDGVRTAQVDFDLPVKWTDAAAKVAEDCFISGWEMARRAYEEEKADEWLKTVYPKYYEEKIAAKEAYKNGMSVTGFNQYLEKQKIGQ